MHSHLYSGKPRSHGFQPRSLSVFVASLLSRTAVPPAATLAAWPRRTGLVRLLGHRFRWFLGAAAALIVPIAYALCACAEHLVGAGDLDRLARCVAVRGEVTPGPSELVEVVTQAVCSLLLVLSFAATALLVLTMPVWENAPAEPETGWGTMALYFARFFGCVGGLMVSLGVFAVCFLVVFFPGLYEGRVPEALLPWQVWFVAAAVGVVARSHGIASGRIEEFTTDLLREPAGPHPLLSRAGIFLAALAVGVRTAIRSRSLDAFGPAGGKFVAGHTPTTVAACERYMEHLRCAIRFYEREGLGDLDLPTSAEARFYTPEQRAAFADTYRRLKTTLSIYEAWHARLDPAWRTAS